MIINFDKRFIFIANLKCASTAIEQVLKENSEVAILEARYGKHLPYRIIEDHFFWTFEFIPKDQFFVFGVIREPVDYLLSLFNSHRDEKFKDDPRLYTGEMSFDDFILHWRKNNEDQMVPQYTRFLDGGGMIAANYIVTYQNLVAGLGAVEREISVEGLSSIRKENGSCAFLKREDLTAKHISWIYRTYRKDLEYIENYTNRVMR